jgi:hypothetical protein
LNPESAGDSYNTINSIKTIISQTMNRDELIGDDENEVEGGGEIK